MSALVVPVPVLTEAEQKELEAIVRKRTTAQRLVERARIILFSAAGDGVAKCSDRVGVAVNTVRLWRCRWKERKGLPPAERLADDPRCGGPARFTPEQVCLILALACEPPEKHGRPMTHWTQQELADEAMKQGIVDYISQRSVGRFLKGGRFAAPSQPLLADEQVRRAQGRKDNRRVSDVRGSAEACQERRKNDLHG